MKFKAALLLTAMGMLMSTGYAETEKRDLTKDKTLYVVGYAHLDSMWRWDYQTTINRYIKATLDENLALLEKYPKYVFNFTGASRYAMMKDYYPDQYEQVKQYIKDGRWFVSGSSVDECDVLMPSPESVLRQILYGNRYFRQEFGVESTDFMLPDCFGFPAYLPTLWAHTGVKGFSTQKLSWGSVVGIPFNVGVWEGPDGNSIIGALNATSYTSSVNRRLDTDEQWIERVNENGDESGVYADYRYYGVGDMGGAPRERDVRRAVASVGNEDGKIDVVLASSSQMYDEITPEQKAKLPRYKGELMLTEHSSGVLTSQAYMKRWNRKNEQLADAAERAAVWADWLGAADYPAERLETFWWRVLVSQMHDILPGTTLPKGYEFAWNDEVLALNGFSQILARSTAGICRGLDTRVKGQAVVVYNPLSIEREDAVTATIRYAKSPEAVRVYDYKGREVPSQVLNKTGHTVEVLFLANVPAVGAGVFDVRESSRDCTKRTGLEIDGRVLENDYYRVTVNAAGDIEQVYDKKAKRAMLSEPARLEFHRSVPRSYPAWNMDWEDRQHEAIGYVDGPAEIKVVENGPVRVGLEVKRKAKNSYIVQRICLTAGEAGQRVEIHNNVDWQTTGCVMKAAFPLTVSNPKATYTQGLGTVQRGNNYPKQYEGDSHEWFDLTDVSGDYGVSVLEDCKFGSDKPSDNVVRLSLLYTPGVRTGYMDQQTQDWGRHEFVYALYGHEGTWQDGLTEYQGRRLNQPLRAFAVDEHRGELGRVYSMLQVNTPQVDVRAIKKAEDSNWTVIRLQELLGKSADDVAVSLGEGIAAAYEIDGQERKIGEATLDDGKLKLAMRPNAIRSFAVKLAAAPCRLNRAVSKPVMLAYNADAFSRDGQAQAGVFGADKLSMPAELIPAAVTCDDITFAMGNPERRNVIRCQGQTVDLPGGDYNRVYLLAAADADTSDTIQIGNARRPFAVQAWTGFIGQYDRRVWDRPFGEVDYSCAGWLTGIETGYIKRDAVAWFGTHRHDADGQNQPYQFSYLYKYGYDLPAGVRSIRLPDNPAIKVFAVSVANDRTTAVPAADLYDNFDGRQAIELRVKAGRYEAGKKAEGTSRVERADSYEELTLTPLTDDYADQEAGNGVEFHYSTGDYSVRPKRGGGDDQTLVRLNDGKVGRNNDDLDRCTFFDSGEGRIIIDLQKPVSVAKLNTFSWHRSDRAPQKFSLWAAREKLSPRCDLYADDAGGWTLVATVDSSSLGEGGVHASSVTFPEDNSYQYLMLITDLDDQGTFFNEIDVITD